MRDLGWTIVQHSGYGYGGKDGFYHATETRKINTNQELTRVKKAGGLVFDNYQEATDFSDKANYPEGTVGIYPKARGTFSSEKIDGLYIYIPVRNVVG